MIRQLVRLGRQYWVVAGVFALLALAFGVSAPAWAAPPAANQYQTVPRPTPTAGADPVATATPRPNDDDDGGGGDTGPGGGAPSADDREVPAFIITGRSDAPASGLTATVTVATLNVREGPGVEYAIIGTLSAGDQVSVLLRNEEDTWYYVCCIPGTETGGWASAQLMSLSFDRAASTELVPVSEAGVVVEAVAPASVDETAATGVTDAVTTTATAGLPIEVRLRLNPPFLAQGESGQLVVRVTNPNAEDVLDVEVSDELPVELELLGASASGGGVVTEQASAIGLPLVIANWPVIPAGETVRLSLTVRVADDLNGGAVFDNLAAAAGSNTGYATGSITIGMPPVAPPDFQ